ncbi:MAG: hypothetical protein SVY10_01670 [Thermodesulfobacteriota bacterium]|nr:hypothetical protein [Thermodesulfobacteriota bacterium]
MDQAHYRVVFRGETFQGHNVEDVKRRFASIFKLDGGEIGRLFSGRPVVVKNGVDHQTAIRYKSAIEQAGGVCKIGTVRNRMMKYASGTIDEKITPSPMSHSQILTCPKCGFEQPETDECIKCGIIIEKYKAQELWESQEIPEMEDQEMDF